MTKRNLNHSIWKFKIEISSNQQITIPWGSEILFVDIQDDSIFIWAIVDTEQSAKETINIQMIGTGRPITKMYNNYIGSVQLHSYVWHIFYELEDN